MAGSCKNFSAVAGMEILPYVSAGQDRWGLDKLVWAIYPRLLGTSSLLLSTSRENVSIQGMSLVRDSIYTHYEKFWRNM
jgi:hypothetical protein